MRKFRSCGHIESPTPSPIPNHLTRVVHRSPFTRGTQNHGHRPLRTAAAHRPDPRLENQRAGRLQAALTAAIRYLNATGVTPSDDALSTLITIPDGTRDRQQPLSASTSQDILAAKRALDGPSPAQPEPPPAPEVPAAVERAIATAIHREPGNTVQMRSDDEGRLYLTFNDIPADDLKAFLAALRRLIRRTSAIPAAPNPQGRATSNTSGTKA